jgi:hypothetical protein
MPHQSLGTSNVSSSRLEIVAALAASRDHRREMARRVPAVLVQEDVVLLM